MTVVITGIGAVTPFGNGIDAFAAGLREGVVAVRPIESFDASSFPTRIAAEVPGPTDNRDRKVDFALAAATEAWSSAGCDERERDAWLSIALGLEAAHLEDFDGRFNGGVIDWDRNGCEIRYRTPLDTAANRVASALRVDGPVVVHASACAAGALALAHAAKLISRGWADVVVCGGSDSMINPLGIGGMSRLGAPSPRASADACRPFDRRRDGLVVGEGAAMFVVESLDRARARGAKPLAVVAGAGSSQDAYKATAPRPDGSSAAEAMRLGLAAAGVEPTDVDWINAHGTGTPLGDPAECKAIRTAFGAAADTVPVSSIKGAIGHLMSAAGAVELAASVLAISEQTMWSTANLTDPDPDCPLNFVIGGAQPADIDVVVSNSFGFGGQNSSVVLRRAP